MVCPNNNKTKIVFRLASSALTHSAYSIVSLAFHYLDDDKNTETVTGDYDECTVTLYVNFDVYDEQVRFGDLTVVMSKLALLAMPEVEED